jgi:hypothetical protein
MRRAALSLCCWLALAAAALAGPALELPREAAGQPGDFVKVAAKTDGKAVRWVALDPGLNVFPVELLKDSKTAVVTAQKPGRYRLLAYTAAGDDPSDPAVCTVVIGDAPPVPPGPVPPGPNPPPVPPQPAPIDGKGLHVLVVFETADAAKLPPAQYNAVYGQAFHDYLDAKTPLSADGRYHEWWVLDKDTDTSAMPKKWQDALKRARASKDFKTPWIIVSNPDKGGGWEGPLPATGDGIMELVKKYGG